jgi:alpha-glucuronidase
VQRAGKPVLASRCRPRPRRCAAARLLWFAWALCGLPSAHAEDGYELWLRYHPLPAPWIERYRTSARELVPPQGAGDAAQSELLRAIAGLLGTAPTIAREITQDGAIVFGTPRSSASIARLHLYLDGLGSEGYVLRSVTLDGHRATVVAATRMQE